MKKSLNRREFLQTSAAGGALYLGSPVFSALNDNSKIFNNSEPGWQRSKVKVARIYMGNPVGLWPKPNLDFKEEIRFYESEFGKLKNEISDVDFFIDELVTSPEQVTRLTEKIKDADGILVIHLSLEIMGILREILKLGKPTMVFAAPYSGHEWVWFGTLRKEELGAKMECILSSDYSQLASAIKPFRAIRHLKESKILNVTERQYDGKYFEDVKNKFGTEIKQITLEEMLDNYNSVKENDARTETEKWINGAAEILEPSREDIFRSCKMALAFQALLDREKANVVTVDCYGTMYEKLCRSYAFPCVGFSRLNSMGLGGICESDLRCAMTHLVLQGLEGKPGFISDPTVDESDKSIILAHCMGTSRMEGPGKPAAPYKLRTIMERQEGVVPQVKMRTGQKVSQAILIGTDVLRYFTGEIIEVPEGDRGCRTKIKVKVDGDLDKLWKNWTSGLHRLTCYGDIIKDLEHFSRFNGIKMINEAV
ncbi:hypothetical protein ACFL4T_14085 [candidate division KSB1 bacterium]